MRARTLTPARPFSAVLGGSTRPQPSKAPGQVSDGVVALPPGKIAAVATYLEMTGVPPLGPDAPLPGRFAPLARDLPRYRALYSAVGAPWLWFSRVVMAEDRLGLILSDPDVVAQAFVVGGRDVGIVELDFRAEGECELSFFGLVPDATGGGLGPRLLREAIRQAFTRPIRRLWLHTCTLDHPAALPIYLKAGFKPYRRAIEVADDPRVTGHMARDAAPLFPTV